MPDPQQHFHFIGICGTAMGSVAAAMKERGHIVTGSDANVYPPMSTFLLGKGIDLSAGYRAENIPPSASQVIVGNAISRGNEEAEAVLERKLLYVSLPEILKTQFLRGKSNYVVSGTHGKTTTASLLTWLMLDGGLDPSFMIGGLPRNLDVGARFTDSAFTVLEGDEYDTAFFDKRAKFLHYLPEVAIINNIEFDHADIYQNLDEIKLAFRRLLNLVPRNGIAFLNGDDPVCREVAQAAPSPVSYVGLGDDCDRRVTNLRYEGDHTLFDLEDQSYQLPMSGEFNVRNASMAICAARHAGLNPSVIADALTRFQGIARRQEFRGLVRGIRIYDDFGHHPTAVRETLRAMRRTFPQSRLWAIFEPRSNTSQRNLFQKELGEALAEADGAILPPISAPEKFRPEDRLDPQAVVAAIRQAGRQAYYEPDVDHILRRIAPLAQSGDIIVVLSNGGFGGIHERLLNEL